MTRKLSVIPNFVIAGAMKCGTTSLHAALEQHPDVSLPEGEVQLLSIDDFVENPVFSPCVEGEWVHQDFDRFFDEYCNWHAARHRNAKSGQILGEDAPTYLSSPIAMARMSELMPDTKIIVALRDPVVRTISHYWHLVRSGRVDLPLEELLCRTPALLLKRSMYLRQLELLFSYFDRAQVHIVLLEQLMRDPQKVMVEIFRFLGVRENIDYVPVHANAGMFPKRFRMTLYRNRLLGHKHGRQYFKTGPRMSEAPKHSGLERILERFFYHFAPMNQPRPPVVVSENTTEFLSNVLFRENRGLDQLVEMRLADWWPNWR